VRAKAGIGASAGYAPPSDPCSDPPLYNMFMTITDLINYAVHVHTHSTRQASQQSAGSSRQQQAASMQQHQAAAGQHRAQQQQRRGGGSSAARCAQAGRAGSSSRSHDGGRCVHAGGLRRRQLRISIALKPHLGSRVNMYSYDYHNRRGSRMARWKRKLTGRTSKRLAVGLLATVLFVGFADEESQDGAIIKELTLDTMGECWSRDRVKVQAHLSRLKRASLSSGEGKWVAQAPDIATAHSLRRCYSQLEEIAASLTAKTAKIASLKKPVRKSGKPVNIASLKEKKTMAPKPTSNDVNDGGDDGGDDEGDGENDDKDDDEDDDGGGDGGDDGDEEDAADGGDEGDDGPTKWDKWQASMSSAVLAARQQAEQAQHDAVTRAKQGLPDKAIARKAEDYESEDGEDVHATSPPSSGECSAEQTRKCESCRAGDPTDGGVSLHGGPCLGFCSVNGYCGMGRNYKIQGATFCTDCFAGGSNGGGGEPADDDEDGDEPSDEDGGNEDEIAKYVGGDEATDGDEDGDEPSDDDGGNEDEDGDKDEDEDEDEDEEPSDGDIPAH
jgi:hypothetical protein